MRPEIPFVRIPSTNENGGSDVGSLSTISSLNTDSDATSSSASSDYDDDDEEEEEEDDGDEEEYEDEEEDYEDDEERDDEDDEMDEESSSDETSSGSSFSSDEDVDHHNSNVEAGYQHPSRVRQTLAASGWNTTMGVSSPVVKRRGRRRRGSPRRSGDEDDHSDDIEAEDEEESHNDDIEVEAEDEDEEESYDDDDDEERSLDDACSDESSSGSSFTSDEDEDRDDDRYDDVEEEGTSEEDEDNDEVHDDDHDDHDDQIESGQDQPSRVRDTLTSSVWNTTTWASSAAARRRGRRLPATRQQEEQLQQDAIMTSSPAVRRRGRRQSSSEQQQDDEEKQQKLVAARSISEDGEDLPTPTKYRRENAARYGWFFKWFQTAPSRRLFQQSRDSSLRNTFSPARCSSCFCVIALVIWINVQVFVKVTSPSTKWLETTDVNYYQSLQAQLADSQQMTKHQYDMKPPPSEGWLFGKKKNQSVEVIAPDCEYPHDWQTTSFTNCNSFHELDLADLFSFLNRNDLPPSKKPRTNSTHNKYISSGLWRDVFSFETTPVIKEVSVLKMMKQEHDVDWRNLDRHRRDALAMERLTASPNVVDIYGYCANTVWTEFLPHGLNDVLGAVSRPNRILNSALQLAQGLSDLHEYDIIHADLQAKQFLVSQDLETIKLNDFNRCRFLPRKINNSTIKCPIRIPSAPGSFRSPEEYSLTYLTEQLDVFSLAHVFYFLLTGGEEPPTKSLPNPVKLAVKRGEKPILAHKYQSTQAKSALAVLMYLGYEKDPQQRIRASELVLELKRLISAEATKGG